jgi:hypothetical protein
MRKARGQNLERKAMTMNKMYEPVFYELDLLAQCDSPAKIDRVLDDFDIASENYGQRIFILNKYMNINQMYESSGDEKLTDEQEYNVAKQLLILINKNRH